MQILRSSLLCMAVAAAASALTGCASAPYRDEIVVFVPVPAPCPRPRPLPRPLPSPEFPPPIIVSAPAEIRSTPLDRNQDAAAPLTKTRETQPTTMPVRPRGEAVGDTRAPIRDAGSTGDGDGAVVPGRTRTR